MVIGSDLRQTNEKEKNSLRRRVRVKMKLIEDKDIINWDEVEVTVQRWTLPEHWTRKKDNG